MHTTSGGFSGPPEPQDLMRLQRKVQMTHDTFRGIQHLFGNARKSAAFMQNTENPTPLLLTKPQAAQLLQISIRTLDLWMRRRMVSYLRIGRTVRFRRSDLEENTGVHFERRSN
jgi:excisionase family DNA binding protein